jgi:hypothetical protein
MILANLVGFTDLLLILAIVATGAACARAILQRPNVLDYAGLAFPLGAGVPAFALFLVSMTGVKLNLTTLACTLILLVIACLVIIKKDQSEPRSARETHKKLVFDADTVVTGLVWLLILGLFFAAAFISIGRAYSSWDAIAIWSAKAYGIAHEQSIYGVLEWGAYKFAYPLNLPLQISYFSMLNGDMGPASKILFPLYYLSLLIMGYRFLKHSGVPQWLASLGVLLIGSVFIFYEHATRGYANLPFTAYLVGGALYMIAGVFRDRPRMQLAGSLMLGLAAWTRAEGIGYCLVVLAVVVVVHFLARRGKLFPAHMIIPLVLLTGIWMIFSAEHIQGSHLGSAVQVYGGGEGGIRIDPVPALLILKALAKHALIPSRLGLIVPLSFALCLIYIVKLVPAKYPEAISLFIMMLGFGGVTLGIFYVRYFSKPDYIAFLHRALDRHILPAMVMLGLVAILMMGSPRFEGNQERDPV